MLRKPNTKNLQMETDKLLPPNHSVWLSQKLKTLIKLFLGKSSIHYLVKLGYIFRYCSKLLFSISCQSVVGLKIIAVFSDLVFYTTTNWSVSFTSTVSVSTVLSLPRILKSFLPAQFCLIMLNVSKQVLPNRVLTSKKLWVAFV